MSRSGQSEANDLKVNDRSEIIITGGEGTIAEHGSHLWGGVIRAERDQEIRVRIDGGLGGLTPQF